MNAHKNRPKSPINGTSQKIDFACILPIDANEKTREPPWKAGEFDKYGKLVKIADNLEASANEQTRGPPCKAGESGKNGKLVKIAHNLEANAN